MHDKMKTTAIQDLLFGIGSAQTGAVPLLYEGWQVAMPDLKGEGRRWLICPWITTDLPQHVLRQGDRVVIRGQPLDFYNNFSNLDALRRISQNSNIEIRRLPKLHAKVYVQEGGNSVVWVGSANLSHAGRYGNGVDSANIEAMVGPLPLTVEFQKQLERLWEASSPVSVDNLAKEVQSYAQTKDNARAFIEEAVNRQVLAVRLSIRLRTASCTLKPQWLGLSKDESPWDAVTFPSIDYINPKSELLVKGRAIIDKVKRDLLKTLIVEVKGATGSGMYILRMGDRHLLEKQLFLCEDKLSKELKPLLNEQRDVLAKNFIVRFEKAFEQFARKVNLIGQRVDIKVVFDEAGRAFDEFIVKNPFAIETEYLIPVNDSSRPNSHIQQAVRTIASRIGLF